MTTNTAKQTTAATLVLLSLSLSVPAQPPQQPLPNNRQPLIQAPIARDLRGSRLVMNYENIDIKVLARILAELTGRNVLVDDAVQGRVTILSSREVTPDEAWEIFKATLARSGFGIRHIGHNFLQVVPLVDNRRESPLTTKKNQGGSDFTTAVLIMKEGDSTQLLTAIRPLLSDPNAAISYAPGKALILTDTRDTVRKIGEMIHQLDTHAPKYEVSVLFPQYCETEKLAPVLQSVLTRTLTTAVNEPQLRVIAFPPTNSLVLQGTKEQIKEAKRLVLQLDLPKSAPLTIEKPRYFLYRLQNGDSEEIAKILEKMLQERKSLVAQEQAANPNRVATGFTPPPASINGTVPAAPTGANSNADNDKAKASIPFVSAKVSSDKETNSVVVYLSPTEYPQIRNLLQALDMPRKQVLLQAVVAEVSLTRLLETGARFQAFTPAGLVATYNGGVTQEGLLSLLSGGNFVAGAAGAGTRTVNVNGRDVQVPSFFSFLSGNKNSSDFDLLSSPRLMTADHKKATMKVGNVVPFATGARFSQNGQPLVTYDYKDVGIKLEFTPHISRSNTIRLELEQEVQEVTDFLNQSLGGTGYVIPLISNRRVKTEVSLKDGETLLVGGLISKRTTETMRKVPLLGDIPLINNFFREMQKEDRKTTLFIAITPFVVNKPEDVARVDRAYEEFLKGEPLPGDNQEEPRRTEVSRHPVEDPYQSNSKETNDLELGDLMVSPPHGEDRLRQARVRVTSRGDSKVVLRSVIRHPDGHLVRTISGPIQIDSGQTREINLPPYDFPPVSGDYEWDLEAVVNDEVVGRIPVPKKIRY
jgi:general secretion pathway protein D